MVAAQAETQNANPIAVQNDPVWDVLNRNSFFLKDAVKGSEIKTSDKLDVYDPETQQLLMQMREPNLGTMTKIRRFIGGDHDAGSPFNMVVTLPDNGPQLMRIEQKAQGFLPFDLPMVDFYDHNDALILSLRKRRYSFGDKFKVYSPANELLFELHVKGVWRGRRFLIEKQEVGSLSFLPKGSKYFRKGKFKCALSISDGVPHGKFVRQMLLAFTVALDRMLRRKPSSIRFFG